VPALRFATDGVRDLRANPPKPISQAGPLKPAATMKQTRKKKSVKTPVKGKASFKRGGFNHKKLSPMAQKIMRRRAAHATKAQAMVNCPMPEPVVLPPGNVQVLPPVVAGDAAGQELISQLLIQAAPVSKCPVFVPSHNLNELHEYLKGLQVPEELFPTSMPRGGKSYSVSSRANAASVQVLHYKRSYFLNYDSNGEVPPAQSVTWGHHADPAQAWKWCKQILNW
jgi:hypothetical protein